MIDTDKLKYLFASDEGMAALAEQVLNQVLDAQMTEHLQARPYERTDQRRAYRNGYKPRQLATRVGTPTRLNRTNTLNTRAAERGTRANASRNAGRAGDRDIERREQYAAKQDRKHPARGAHRWIGHDQRETLRKATAIARKEAAWVSTRRRLASS